MATFQQHKHHRNGKATSDGDMADDVSTHFRIAIPSGQSSFTVNVPLHHITPQRRFFFNHLEVIPDFFSLEAEKLELDADPQLDRFIERDVQVKIHYPDPKTVYGPPYDHNNSSWNTLNFIKHINKHFESKKPNFAYTTPFFIDWIDEKLEKTSPSTDYVPLQTLVYYSEDYDESKHWNFLPESARDIEGVNNFVPPLGGKMATEELYSARIRLRLWMAPYTRAVFSNVNLFVNGLGFKTEQLGFVKNRQHHLVNDKPYWLPVAVSTAAPKIEIPVYPFKLTLQASDSTFVSRIKHVALVQRDWLDNAKLITTLSEAFKQSSRSFNVAFSIAYDPTTRTFAFSYPDDSDAVVVSIICEPEFAHRLGFGFSPLITKGMKAAAKKERHSIKDAHLSAVAVVYDTGLVICELDQVASNTTSGLIDKTVASLYPNWSGTLRMPSVNCTCTLPSRTSTSSFPILVNTHSTGATYPVTFQLKRIYDDESCSDFNWTSDAFVYGVLQGSCLKV